MEPQLKTGFPKCSRGLNGHYIFEVKFNDDSICDAVVKDDQETHEKSWLKNKTWETIPPEQITAWRETYTCTEATMAIDQYRARRHSIVAKENLSDALKRHIKGEPCEMCQKSYDALFPEVQDPGFDPISLVGAESL